MVVMQFGINVLSFFPEDSCSFRCFQSDGNSLQTLGTMTEKARLPKLSFVLGTISCCEIDDLSCLGIFERCRKSSEVGWLLCR